MTQLMMKSAVSIVFAMSAVPWAVPAQAATDYLLIIEGVDGESKAIAGVGGGAMPHVKGDARHKGWIELDSVQFGVAKTATGGDVAPHDLKSPKDVATGHASGKRTHNPVRIVKQVDKSTPLMAKTASDEETAAMLLPAIQKVREAAARISAWTGCAAGQKLEGLAIKQKSNGRNGRILDATVNTCAADMVSFNFTKIEWD